MAINPFYVHPGADLGLGLKGLGEQIENRAQVAMQRVKMQKQQEQLNIAGQMMKSGDMQGLSEIILKNPAIGEQITASMNFKNTATKENASEAAFKILSGENPQQVLTDRVDFLTRSGGDPSGTIKLLQSGTPDEINKMAEMTLMSADPKLYKTWKESTSVAGLDMTTVQKEYAQAQQQGFTGSLLEWKMTTGGKGKTEAIKEYEYGLNNPNFALRKLQKEQDAVTKSLSKQTFSDSKDLRKEYLKQSGDFIKVRDAYTRVVQSTQDPSPAGDLALIFNYMKMLDPDSTVRESEFATAASAGSYGERFQASAQKVISGERLSTNMRKDFLSKSASLLTGMERQHDKRIKTYTDIATRNHLPVEDVVVDIGKADQGAGGDQQEGETGTSVGSRTGLSAEELQVELNNILKMGGQ